MQKCFNKTPRNTYTDFLPVCDIFQFPEEENPFALRLGHWFHDPDLARVLLEFLHKDVILRLTKGSIITWQLQDFNLGPDSFNHRKLKNNFVNKKYLTN